MESNSKRVLAIDLARGISILMVIIVHTLWMYGDTHTQSNTWVGSIIHFIGKGTPMFLMTMGFSYLLSRNQSLKLSIKRSGMLLLAAYGMNFLKFVLPTLVGITPDQFIEAYGWTPPATGANLIYMLLTGDILQLAGVSLLFMGLINHFSKNKYVPLIIAIAIMIVTPYVRGFRFGIVGLDYVLDLLWGAAYNVYFAVFPWFSFILIGMFFGRWFVATGKNTNFVFNRMPIIGVVFLGIGASLCYYDFEFHFGDYFHLGTGGSIYLAGFNLLLIWIAYLLVTYVKNNAFFQFCYFTSKRVTTIYVIQWVIICWGMGILGYQQFDQYVVLALIPVTMIVTLALQLLLDRLLTKKATTISKSNNTVLQS